MSETNRPKPISLELSMPLRGYRKWLRATHYAIQRFPEFVVARFVLQPDGLPLDDCVVVLNKERLKQQEDSLLKFLQKIGLPDGEPPRCLSALRTGETFNAGWVAVAHGPETEICFCGLSPNAVSQVAKGAVPKGGVEVDPLVSVNCSSSLMRHFLQDLFTE